MSETSDTPPEKRGSWYRLLFSLRWRLVFVYVALFGIFVAILSVFIYSSTSALLLHNGQAAFPQHVQQIRSELMRDACNTNTLNNLSQVSDSLLQQEAVNDIDEVAILDASGQVLASSNAALLHKPFPYLESSFFVDAPTNVSHAFQTSQVNGSPGDGLILSFKIPTSCNRFAQPPTYLTALTTYNSEHTTMRNILLTVGGASLVLVIFSAFVIAFLTGIMMRPLQQVTQATQAFAKGDLETRVPLPETRDELGMLAASFNQMADRVEQTFEAYQDSQRRTQRFFSDASHELRTPITSLRGFTEVLMRGAKDDPETARRVLGLMKNEAERMSRLVNDLLTLARLDEGRPVELSTVDVVNSAIESIQQAKALANQHCKISLDLATQERLQVQANADQLKQMLLLLLDNAVKYGCPETNPKITLRLDKHEQQALIQVIDHGQGITPEDLPHVFDRFYRGSRAYEPVPGGAPVMGTGLGLSIALAIAQSYHGTITVASEPDQETTFTASLPCIE